MDSLSPCMRSAARDVQVAVGYRHRGPCTPTQVRMRKRELDLNGRHGDIDVCRGATAGVQSGDKIADLPYAGALANRSEHELLDRCAIVALAPDAELAGGLAGACDSVGAVHFNLERASARDEIRLRTVGVADAEEGCPWIANLATGRWNEPPPSRIVRRLGEPLAGLVRVFRLHQPTLDPARLRIA